MKLITCIKVEGFRSLADTTVEPLGNLNCLIGANNSGKSNILRALNLFFTGMPDRGLPLGFSQDYYAAPKSRKKKRIRVSVSFSLPQYFTFRKGLEHVANKLGKDFTIRKTWELYQPEPQVELAEPAGNFQSVDAATVKQFTDLINFRYIQNRIVPAEALRAESAAFQAYVNRRLRLRQKKISPDLLLKIIRDTASEVVQEANLSLTRSTDSIKNLEMSTPLGIASLARVAGFRAEIKTGARITDVAWGSGTQAYMMFHLLKLIDTDFGTHFGWREAAIWAVEEPESSLHKDLEQQLAIDLRNWSDANNLRMQVFTTTHSEVFVTAASEAFLVKLDGEGRSNISHKEIPELVHTAATMGVSGPVEPVFCYLLNPVVLVEGPLDRRVLSHVAQETRVAADCKFISLCELDPIDSGGGAEQIVTYLKRYARLIRNRPAIAPLVVLFDHDVPDHVLNKARDYYGAHADLRVKRMDVAHADPKVSSEIKGIERFYPAELFRKARETNKLDVAIDQNGNISIEGGKIKKAKTALANMLCQAPDKTWYTHLEKVLSDVQVSSSTRPGSQMKLH